MSVRTATAWAVGASVLCFVLGSGAMAQEVNDKPLEENWWPSEWGPDDKVGSPIGPRRRWSSKRSAL